MSDRASYQVSSRRFAPLCVLFVAGVLFLAFGGHRYLTLAALAENRNWMCALVKRAEAPAALGFILAYAGLVALSVPGAALLTITGGFLFGPWLGGSYAVVGATIGATIVFLAARAGLSGLAARASPWMRRVDDGFRANGLSYLLVLRLIPVIPFWLVNLVAAAAGLRLSVYIVGTFIGMIPVTLVYASLGNGFGALIEQGQQPDLAILFRPNVLLPLLGLAALALAPVLYQRWRTRGR